MVEEGVLSTSLLGAIAVTLIVSSVFEVIELCSVIVKLGSIGSVVLDSDNENGFVEESLLEVNKLVVLLKLSLLVLCIDSGGGTRCDSADEIKCELRSDVFIGSV